jgi:hypothetical protein
MIDLSVFRDVKGYPVFCQELLGLGKHPISVSLSVSLSSFGDGGLERE